MTTIDGIITIAQESRFQLVDDRGVGHFLVLDALALAEPGQLVGLARNQTRVRVRTAAGNGIVGQVAKSISVV